MALSDAIAGAPRPQKIVAGIIALVIVSGLGYFVISPKLTERETLRQRNEALQAEVQKARADEANLRPFRQQAEVLRKRLETAKGRLPSEKEIPALYRQVSDLAFQSGLLVALFAPKAPEDRDSVAEIPVTVTAEGTYHQFGAFFSRLGRIQRIVNLGDFRMAGIERPSGSVRGDLTLATYLFRQEGERPESRAPGAAAPAAPHPPGATR